MRIGLAQTRFPKSAREGLEIVKVAIADASVQGCELICFPESIIPGLRGVGFPVEDYDHEFQAAAITEAGRVAKQAGVGVILPMEWKDETGYHLAAFVIGKNGEVLGYQTKNQIDPDEDQWGFVPGQSRELFEMDGVKFGVVICHEGWRYPETVRWAAVKGASIVFHPQFTGSVPNPDFYNGALLCRSSENNIYFASVNYALEKQGCTTTLISPEGERLHALAENEEGLLVMDIDPTCASRLLASRYHPDLF